MFLRAIGVYGGSNDKRLNHTHRRSGDGPAPETGPQLLSGEPPDHRANDRLSGDDKRFPGWP
jgi:hypothetical protein